MSDNTVGANLSSLIAKINKLRALAENNSNLNEAEAARAAADKLIQAHRIEAAELDAAKGVDPNADPFVSLPIHEGGRRTLWRESILSALATHYGFAYYFSSSRKTVVRKEKLVQERSCNYIAVARKSDYEIASFMFQWITSELERLSRWHNGGKGVAAGKSWLDGAAVGVAAQYRKLNADMRAQAATSAAMVILSRPDAARKEMERQHPRLRTGAAIGGARADMSSYYNGYDVGSKLPLAKPLNAAAKPNALT